MKDKIVIYHANCWDGFAAAWVCWLQFDDTADYLPWRYDNIPESMDMFYGKEVYIVDFSFKRQIIEDINQMAKKLVVIDHHKTAQAELTGLDYCIFNMEKSGCVLTWDYFNKHSECPLFLKYIQDRDLWKFVLGNSKKVNAAIQSYPMTFGTCQFFANYWNVEQLALEGKAILRYQNQLIKKLAKNPRDFIWGDTDYQCLEVESNILWSEICHYLLETYPECDVAIVKRGNLYDLRSRPDGPDVAKLAETMGGGGHKHASGYSV